VKAEVLEQSKGGMWAWLFQRVTAVLLIIGFASHLISTHIMAIGELSYDNIAHRLASTFFVVMDVMLLAAVLYHALNGLRMVVLDYWFTEKGQRTALTFVLWVAGLVVFVYGLWALWPWITG
jgi:succinate dehydrogenase cytochrome b556 subunit